MLVKKKQPYSSSKPTTNYTNDVPPYLSIDLFTFHVYINKETVNRSETKYERILLFTSRRRRRDQNLTFL